MKNNTISFRFDNFLEPIQVKYDVSKHYKTGKQTAQLFVVVEKEYVEDGSKGVPINYH